jgi:hypothetical protein
VAGHPMAERKKKKTKKQKKKNKKSRILADLGVA